MVNLLTCVYVLRSIRMLPLLFISQPKLGGVGTESQSHMMISMTRSILIHKYLHKYMHIRIHVEMHAHTHAIKHTNMQAYIQTHTPTYV